ncbi:uncharacterized protein DMAD_01844 [Drosophila madeirensis]|uniref:Uncharacterized protein n=1 Tax=Drosophila madeirensis TaxID=30013 RepID=A0AAU9G2D2_DROMD
MKKGTYKRQASSTSSESPSPSPSQSRSGYQSTTYTFQTSNLEFMLNDFGYSKVLKPSRHLPFMTGNRYATDTTDHSESALSTEVSLRGGSSSPVTLH